MTEWSSNQITFGSETPPAEPIPLRAGPLTLRYGDGEIRDVEAEGRILLLRLYAAVRDGSWKTVPGVLTRTEAAIAADSFRIAFEMEHRQGNVDFVWRGTLTGASEGMITFEFDGEARTTFDRNRIGFCLLLPAQFAGVKCSVQHTGGGTSEAVFPDWIDPDQPVIPFSEMRSLTLTFEDGIRACAKMEGDIFEMEDQRNWTDASYKIFCTPLRLPFPVTVPGGARVHQKIILSLDAPPPRRVALHLKPHEISLKQEDAAKRALPPVGIGMAATNAIPDAEQTDRLKRLSPAHLRCEIRLSEDGWQSTLEHAILFAQTLKTPLELALLLPENCAEPQNCAEPLRALRACLEAHPVSVVRWLILPEKENLTQPQPFENWLPTIREIISVYAPAAPIIAGTNSDFIFLNRFPPPTALCDGVSFAINPQVHAFDNVSLVETLATQITVARAAANRAGGVPVHVGPVAFLPRFNPYGAEQKQAAPPADTRQKTLFGAAWTLGSLCALTASGAASLTYYETSGPGGVLENDYVFPLYHVQADYNEFRGGQAVPLQSGNSSAVVGIELSKDSRRRVLLANLTPRSQKCALSGIASDAAFRVLDETTARRAIFEPEAFRETPPTQTASDGRLRLAPYATVCMDWTI